MKLVFYSKLNRFWLEKIEGLQRDFDHVEFVTDRENIGEQLQSADAVVAGELTPELLRGAPNVKIIFVPYAGADALPFDQIKSRHIRVANVHGNAPYVAERAIAMALGFYGKIIDFHNDLKNTQWHGYWASGGVQDSWSSMQGRTGAVLGTGAIGQFIARYLKAFDCRVIGFKKRPADRVPDFFDEMTTDLQKAIDGSEMVFVTLPLTRDTAGLISAEILSRMKGKFLVNVGRGEVVDEKGLYVALREGVLKGAAIDVWYTYPEGGASTGEPSRYPIHELPNVILSPHLAGFTPQAARLNIEQTIENIRSYLKTGRALYELDPESMY
ncbi:MAG: 2-hydroxyacid dehydrogenase [Pseudomonadota bacterium]